MPLTATPARTAADQAASEAVAQDQAHERCPYCNGGDLHSVGCWALSQGVSLWRTHSQPSPA